MMNVIRLGLVAALIGGGCSEAGDVPASSTQSLNGQWTAAEGALSDTPPELFDRQVPVPGLITNAVPAYEEVGVVSPRRDAFWYRTTFTVNESPAAIARLRIHKAKYGTKVWLNGEELGEHFGSYTRQEYDASKAIRYGASNTLLVRVGADRDKVPRTIPAAQDVEKERFIPGIWDDVELVLSGAQTVERVLVEPDVSGSRARIRTTIRNRSTRAVTVQLQHEVREWVSGSAAAAPLTTEVLLGAGAEETLNTEIALDAMHLWSPDDPFLYVAHTRLNTDGAPSDEVQSRFGMRTVEWRAGADKGFYLNGTRLYLRGSNLSLHRFFEDPRCEMLPWDEDWVRELLSGHPRALSWNSMRVSIGRLPRNWYDIADEEGLLLVDEFQWWSIFDAETSAPWSVDELEAEFTSWILDNFNHPSIMQWDASNETPDRRSAEVIQRVRGLDPTRQWENGGYNAPQGPNDPIEDHHYLFQFPSPSSEPYEFTRIDESSGAPPSMVLTYDAPDHPYVLNEYGWAWINRDGTPTALSRSNYEGWLGDAVSDPAATRETYAYLVSGLTAFWRAKRGYAGGVQHFAYLGYSRPVTGDTSDNFLDVASLALEPRWQRYARSAFAPVAVYIDSWEDSYAPDSLASIPVIAINDTHETQTAELELLAVDDDGTVLASSTIETLTLEPLGSYEGALEITIPAESRFVLFAELRPDSVDHSTVWSRRKIGYAHPGEAIPDPPFVR
jgi:beta-galactosidase